MADHMNSPKIRKAIQAVFDAEAKFSISNKELIAHIESEPEERTWEWVWAKNSKEVQMKEDWDNYQVLQRDALRLVWAYYRERKYKNSEILPIVNQLFEPNWSKMTVRIPELD